MLGGIILIYIDAHFSHGRRLPDVSFKVSTSSRPLTKIASLLGLKPKRRRFADTFFNFPPPSDIVARAAAQSPTAPTAPTRSTGHARVPRGSVAAPVRLERRGRSVCPRCSRERRLFRHCGVKQESPGNAEKAPGTKTDGSWSRTGPNECAEARRVLVGGASHVSCPCWARRQAVAALCAVAAVHKTGGCGGSGGRSASIGVGGSLPCRPACSGVSALASGLLRGLEA